MTGHRGRRWGTRPSVDAPTVAFVFNQRIYRVGSRHYAMTPNLLDLMVAMRRHAGGVVVCAPTRAVDTVPDGSESVPDELQVCELPFYASNLDLVLRSPILGARLLRRLLHALPRWDVVGGDAPSGFGMAAVILAIASGRKGFFYVRGSHIRTVREQQRQMGCQGALILAAFWPLDVAARALSRAGVPTFAMGEALARRHGGPRVHVLRGYARPAVVGADPAGPVFDPVELSRLGYVGRLAPEKGVDVLLRALAVLLHHRPDFVLTLVGDGPDAERLNDLACDLGVQDSVTFVGNVTDTDRLRRLYMSAGIICVPSRTEGIPVAMLEAMALGRVVVATRVGGIPSAATDERDCLLVPPDDPQAMATAVLRLTHEPELAFRLARGAASTGRARSIDAQAATIIERAWTGAGRQRTRRG